MLKRLTAVTAALLLIVACADQTTEPNFEFLPQFAKKADLGHCATDPDHVVTDSEELFAAMDGAQEGDVIAVDGVINTVLGARSFVNGITLTCATPGAGIVAGPDWNPETGFLLRIFGSGVSVTHLFLDAAVTPRGPIYGQNNGTTTFAENLVFTNNNVVCGAGECLFFVGVSGGFIADNHFESAGGNTGIHIQGGGDRLPDGSSPYQTDNTQVLRNTVVSVAPSPISSGFGGIRVRDGSNILVSRNVVTGPWSNSLSPSELSESTFSHNTLRDAQVFGIRLSFNPFTVLPTPDNAFRNNKVSGAGEAGAYVTLACGNLFVGNVFKDTGGDVGVWFDVQSGGNVFLGNHNIVVDDGDYDCNGDEVANPNVITGPGLKLSGVKLGDFMRYATLGQGKAALR